jgi:hypothetical protein
MMSFQVVAQGTSGFGYTLSPTDGKYPVAVTQQDFVITMNTPVKAVYNGIISLSNYNGTEYVPIQLRSGYETSAGSGVFNAPAGSEFPWKVTFSGTKVTINFGYTLKEFHDYYIEVSENAIQNASGTLRFIGLKNNDEGVFGTLTKGDDAPGWDFTTEDLTPPTPVWSAASAVNPLTDPTDEEINVSPSLTTFTLKFSEDVIWKSNGLAGFMSTFNVGDIALYRSTEVGVYGGDVVFPACSSATITGNVLTITWPGALPSKAKLYVRIKPGLITDKQNLAFAGFNTNGTGAGIGWNFSTKDATVPTRAFAMVGCASTADFTITLNETGIVLANTRAALTNGNIDALVSFSGGAFDATVAEVSGTTVITINPTAALTSGGTYTVSLLDGLWDSGDNAIPATLSPVFTAGDYTAPTTDIFTWKNPDGTSFNINLRVNNEPAGTNTTYYYIVVKASDALKGSDVNGYQPEHDSVLFNAATSVFPLTTNISAATTTAQPSTAYFKWRGSASVTTDDRFIPVFQRGDIIAPANVELLEHVVSLPASHGTDWVVYLFGADGSLCGSSAVPGVASTKNVTGVQNIRPSTYDIIPPTVNFSALLVDAVHDTIDGCSEKLQVIAGDNGVAMGIRRFGPIYINFNEAVENANGSTITGATIASSVTLTDDAAHTYTVNQSLSYYDAANKRMVIVPTTPFASDVTVTATLLANKVQDAMEEPRFGPNGTELLVAQSAAFCVESYEGPVVTLSPCSPDGELDRVGDIVIYVDQDLYAPAIDGGGLLSNDTAAVNFVGKYLQVREHPAAPTSTSLRDAGTIVYNGETPTYFYTAVNVTVTYPASGDGDSTIITISPKNKSADFWKSETWYSIEIDQSLHSADFLDLTSIVTVDPTELSPCTIDNYWGYFMAEDSREPLCIFYEDEPVLFDVTEALGTADPLLDGNVTVEVGSNIRVSIDEWMQLGFDGYKNLETSDIIDDANALRRYFALYEVNGSVLTPISFDVKIFTLGPGDIADFYIDPYYPNGVETNWTKGKNYRVCFIDNPNEFEQYRDLPALTDDNLNGVTAACASFTCPADAPAPSCLTSATFNGQTLYTTGTSVTNVAVTGTNLSLVLNFANPIDQPTAGEVALVSACGSVQTVALNGGTRSTNRLSITYTFDVSATSCPWVENTNYWLTFSGTGFISNAICTFPASVDPFNDIHTVDGSAPVITSFIPDLVGAAAGPCMIDKNSTDILITWNEGVTEQTGKKLEIWRDSIVGLNLPNTLVASLDASWDTTAAGDVYMKIPNSLFKNALEYNTYYYIQITEGFVKNAVGLPSAAVANDDSLRFCVGPDPVPAILCNKFVPADGSTTPSTTPVLVVEFSESVAPVSGTDVEIFEGGETNSYLHVLATAFTPVAGSNGTKWQLNTANAFVGQPNSAFEWGNCYYVNIDAGAFRETSGSQVTPALITVDTDGAGPIAVTTPCDWMFCIGDNVAPTVTFWPVKATNMQQHVATNSFLYAYISELPVIDVDGNPATNDRLPLNVTNVEQFFRLTRGVLNTPVNFDVEFVGNDIVGGDNQKQRIRVVPRDPDGPDWSLGSTTPTMVDDSIYTLSIVNPDDGVNELTDEAGNRILDDFVQFRVEDITCPVLDVALYETATASADSVWMAGSIDEAGKVRFVVVADGATAPAASAVWGAGFSGLGLTRGEVTVPTTAAPNYNFAFRFGLHPIAAPYGYDVYVYLQDDEVDLFDTDAEIMAEWPYTMTPTFETEVYRIKDLRPSPNWCNSSTLYNATLCDNDAPLFVKSYPVNKGVSDPTRVMQFPVGDSIMLVFSENIQINDGLTGNKIVLRDAHNNLGVPLAYRIWGGDTLMLYPLDTLNITSEADAFQPWTGSNDFEPLDEQRDYYLEIDRYAISDVDGCGTSVNYFGEWIGKEKLAFRTEDNTGPCLISWTPSPSYSDPYCIDPEADLTLKFSEINTMMVNPNQPADSAYIYIYKVGQIAPHERIPASRFTAPVNARNSQGQIIPDQWIITAPTAYLFESEGTYRVRIPANLFVDNSGNTPSCLNGFSWTFEVRDYEDPIASWTVIQDFTYLDIAYDDPEYPPYAYNISGPAGGTASNVPTSSLLKVEFNEEVYVRDSENSNAWTAIDQAAAKDEVAASITLKETFNGVTTTLTYDSDGYGNTTNVGNWEFQEIGADYAIIRVYRAEDHWMPNLTSPFAQDFGLKSNASYTIKVAASTYADEEDCDNTRNIYDGNDPLVTVNTRDDVPPTLTITDATESAVCGSKCVAAGAPLHLQFSSAVVKTPWAGIDYDVAEPFANLAVNWWTIANLPLTPADLLVTDNGDFLNFRYLGNGASPAYPGTAVSLSGVTVNANGKDILLTPAANLVSQGWYLIEFSGGSVKDQKRIPDGNEFAGMSCVFRVKDTVLPLATAFFPADKVDASTATISNALGTSTLGAATFGPDSMAIMFSEPIKKSTSAEKLVVRRMNGQIFDEVAISSCTVDAVDKRVLVIPVKPLEEFTSYYVEVPAGYVLDTTACTPNGNVKIDPEIPYATGNRFAWNFSTEDDTPPSAITYIPNDTDTVPRNSNLTIIFDENIYADLPACANAAVYVYRHDDFAGSGGWVGNPDVDFGNVVEVIPFFNGSTPNYTLDGTSIYNGFNRDKIIFNPTNDFSRVGTYYIRVSGGCIKDGMGNAWSGLGDSTTWKFTVTNDVAPVLASTTPAYNHTTAPWQYVELPADDHGFVIADLSMKFVDAVDGLPLMVAPGLGKLKIMEYRYNPATFQMEEKLWKEYNVNDPAVVFNNDVVTINDVLLRDNINKTFGAYEECYYVTADPGTVTNGYPGSQTFWSGINNAFVWRFQTAADDVFVAGYSILSPNIAEDGVGAQNLTIPVASKLEVEFNEGIEALAAPAGKVQIFKVGVSAPVDEIVVTQAMVSGKKLTVPTTKLVDETNYYVQVQAGAFGDTSTVSTANLAFGGADVWAFQTGDNTAPAPVTLAPAAGCVGAQATLTMTFNESRGVVKGSGNLEVVDAEGTVIDQVAAADIVISASGNTVTAVVAGLPDTTLLTVNVPAGFLFDGDTHSPLANAAFSWTFTTGENTVPTVAITPDVVTTADTVLVLTFSEVVNPVAGKVVTVGEEAIDVADFTTADGIVYTLPLADLTSEATYAVVVEAGAFVDVNAGCVPNGVAATTESFIVGDLTAPIVSGSPETAADYVGLVLSLNFDDAVTAAAGNVKIYDAETDAVIETIASSAFTAAAGNTVYTYAPKNVRFGEYYILIDAGAFVDNSAAPAGKSCAGISDPTEWTLSVIDPEFVNCYNIIAPLRATQNVPLTTKVEISFCDERIAAGVGAVTIGDQSIDRILGVNYFEYPVTAGMISGNKLTINVSGLKENTTYSIIIPQGAITDEAGNPFIGITDANLWIFTTGDFTNPVVSVAAVTVMNDGTGAPVAITSSEAGIVYLAKDDVAANAAALLAAIAQNKAVAATLTAPGAISVSVEGLVPGTYKAYAFDASGRMGTAVNSVIVTAPIPVTLYTIAQIQGTGANSPLAGQQVRTKGTVTAVTSTGYYMQDANAAWSGIFVASTQAVSVNSSVEVTGTAAEVGGITTINTVTKTEFVAPVVEVKAVVVTTALTENFESVLVSVTGRAAAAGAQTGDWTAGTYTINNALYGSYTTKLQYNYGIEGIVAGTKVLAVDITNISEKTDVNDLSSSVKVYPNPFDKFITLEVSSDVVITKAVITNIAGQLVKEVNNPSRTISTSDLRSGVYFISLHSVDGIAKTERIIKK